MDDRWARMAANPVAEPAGAIELPGTGWGAHIAWVAGPAWVHPVDLPVPRVRRVVVRGEGTVTTEHDRTAEDQAAVDEDTADYLADAGIPPPPSGIRWALRRPRGLDGYHAEEFWRRLNAALAQRCPRARLPREVHACLVPIVETLLSDAGPPPR